MRGTTAIAAAGLLAAVLLIVFVPGWEQPKHPAQEISLPGNVQFAPVAAAAALNHAPPALPAAEPGGKPAAEAYKNVQVLGDLSAPEFMRLQQAITQWVSPQAGCGFCHAGADYASDDKPQKRAARTMLRMTRHINADWAEHVQPSGVTCFACHRGQPVPPQIWFPDAAPPVRELITKRDNWQEQADTVRKFFPDSGWSEYYLQDEPIAVESLTALPSGTISAMVVAKRVYEMMMQLSDGIGVNCGYCHASRNFTSWEESTPYRWAALTALKLVRDLNRNFLLAVAEAVPQTRTLVGETALPVLPARQTGAQAGNGLVVCATCHAGLPKPLNGEPMLRDYPGLGSASLGSPSLGSPSLGSPSLGALHSPPHG